MARRNPMNERYQKHTAPAGKTRKSAAAAKPKRAIGDAPTQKKSSPGGRPKAAVMMHPPTPEYKRLRRFWWALLGGAMALSVASWWMWQNPELRQYGNYVLIGAYACLGFAIWLDFARLRPLRVEYNQTGGKPPKETTEKPGKTDKESD